MTTITRMILMSMVMSMMKMTWCRLKGKKTCWMRIIERATFTTTVAIRSSSQCKVKRLT